jgi:hypothetical protein
MFNRLKDEMLSIDVVSYMLMRISIKPKEKRGKGLKIRPIRNNQLPSNAPTEIPLFDSIYSDNKRIVIVRVGDGGFRPDPRKKC